MDRVTAPVGGNISHHKKIGKGRRERNGKEARKKNLEN